MSNLNDLANLIFKDLPHNRAYYESLYSKRDKAVVTRFAPSPTGFLHLGSLYMAYMNYLIAKESDGVFYIRIEDTDTKREVQGSSDMIIKELELFGITCNNDPKYGPYFQSLRKEIYDAFIYDLIINDKAYPCFMSEEEINDIREYQTKNNLRIGIYKEFSKSRSLSIDEMISKINNNIPYVIRYKSNGNYDNTFTFHDLVKGDITFHENDFDIVIRKSDNLPTYHFAHVIDDTLMGTSVVIRGEEWLNSVPVHYDLFSGLNFNKIDYMHLSPIMVLDNGNKRKLSKRLDKEADVLYFLKSGYHPVSILNYLLTLANSKYENNLFQPYKLDLSNFNKTGAILDMDKINYIAKEYLFSLDENQFLAGALEYTSKYDLELYQLIKNDPKYFNQIIALEHKATNPRKDYVKYSDLRDKIFYFYDSLFDNVSIEIPYPKDIVSRVLNLCLEYNENCTEEEWLLSLKQKSLSLGFAKNAKEAIKLNVLYAFSDFMQILRLAVCKTKDSFNLFDVIRIIGEKKYFQKLKNMI